MEFKWCTFTEQTAGPATHHSPAAGGTIAPPPIPAPTPSISGSIPPPVGENLIDLNSLDPTPIQGLMAHLNI